MVKLLQCMGTDSVWGQTIYSTYVAASSAESADTITDHFIKEYQVVTLFPEGTSIK